MSHIRWEIKREIRTREMDVREKGERERESERELAGTTVTLALIPNVWNNLKMCMLSVGKLNK
jgi:hypothetical protein